MFLREQELECSAHVANLSKYLRISLQQSRNNEEHGAKYFLYGRYSFYLIALWLLAHEDSK